MSDYEHLLELVRSRRSIRRFSGRAVDRDDLARLFEAARWAPSNHNRQPWRFLVIEDPARITRLAEAVRQHLEPMLKSLPEAAAAHAAAFTSYATCFSGAPVLLVVLHQQPIRITASLLAGLRNPDLISGEPLSVAMAVQNLLLAARALELGTCVLTGPLLVREVFAAELTLPAGHELNCLVALGYPAETPPPPRRKTLEHIVEFASRPPTEENPA
ncbi:MAG TPA: nitroreductase family protein [Verrucomicrobiota bacterium]|nr:nitroreductase family protein [Verrucomicrobiota bacterium]HNU52790.1 nitroreductase family protein [Verrucomicrobiota bacterium]